jgi:ribonuclease HII
MPLYKYDTQVRNDQGVRLVAGIDEAGRGPIAGPVVASAVILPPGVRIEGVRDSKKLSEKKRTFLFYEILARALYVGVGLCDVDEIETLNILGATKHAMKAAIRDLGLEPEYLLLDAVKLPDVLIRQSSPIKGDDKSASIAAASIIAKHTRDTMMKEYHKTYPQYGFERHKGYGTKEHMALVKKYGPCPIHRMGFRGVKNLTLPF